MYKICSEEIYNSEVKKKIISPYIQSGTVLQYYNESPMIKLRSFWKKFFDFF